MSTSMIGSGAAPQRDWGQAVGRGLRLRCPACGQGRLFRAFLKVTDRCERCGEDLHHQRADDAPPYVTISIVGHVVIGGLLVVEAGWPHFPLWAHWAIWPALGLVMSLALLPSIKGALVGHQWALRMHGFGGGGGDS